MEAAKLGFETCILSKNNLKGIKRPKSLRIIGVTRIEDALEEVL